MSKKTMHAMKKIIMSKKTMHAMKKIIMSKKTMHAMKNQNVTYAKTQQLVTVSGMTQTQTEFQNPNEPGIAGVTVNLWTNVNNAPGSIINTTTTNANGNYLFTNVVPGAYWLQFLVPDALGEWVFTLQNQGTDDAKDSDANASGIAGPICLVCGECDPNWDAGLFQYAKLGDRVWNDLNANGIQDVGESGIAGVIVNLWTSR